MRLLIITILLFTSFTLQAKINFDKLFKVKKPVIAAIMLDGNYETARGKQKILDFALKQLQICEEENVNAALYEFRGGGIGTPQISKKKFDGMIDIMKKIIGRSKNVVIGVEILWHYPKKTILLAKKSGSKFVRLDFFSDKMIAGGKKVPINPEAIQQFRKSHNAMDIALFTDIQVKYAKMINKKTTMSQSAAKAERNGSDGLIVSGKKSGSQPSANRVKLAKDGSKKLKVIICS